MMLLCPGTAQMPQDAQVTSSRTVAGHTETWRPAGVFVGLVVPTGSTQATGAMPNAASSSARSRESADRLMMKPASFAALMAVALCASCAS